MSGNEYERFPNLVQEICLEFGLQLDLVAVHSVCFFSKFCSVSPEKPGTNEYQVFTA